MMDNLKKTKKNGPEAIIQAAIIKKLESLRWLVKSTHGNMYQAGFPDLYACHNSYGARWIEVKNPLAYSFTPAQILWFKQFNAHGIGVWILVSDSDLEISKLFGPSNWYQYLKF